MIASGKTALMLCSGHFSQLQTKPRCLYKPAWLKGMTLLEYYVKKAKSLGDYGRGS